MDKGKAVVRGDEFVSLEALRVGAKQLVKVMVCRKWDVVNTYGKYKSTDYILSDDQGNTILCSARSNISHRFVGKVEEGKIYSVEGFTIAPNKDKYRIRHTDERIIELEGYSVVQELDVSPVGFVRYPFQLIPLDEIHANDSTFLIDVMGCVIEVGMIRSTKTGSDLLEFQLIGDKGTRVRVTLWGALCKEFMDRPGLQNRTYIVILPSMNIKEYRGEIYLSSTSATTIFDSLAIPQIFALNAVLTVNNTPATSCLPPPALTRTATLRELIHLGKEQKETRRQTVAVRCTVRVESVRTKDSWFYYSCGAGGCKRRLSRVGTGFWCETCKKKCEFPRTSYRLHLNVADDTGAVVATLFDEAAESILKKKAAAFLEQDEVDASAAVVPQEILDLCNTCHVFEMKTHTYFDGKTYTSFTVSKVTEAYVKQEVASLTLGKRARDDGDEVGDERVVKKLRPDENAVSQLEPGNGATENDTDTSSIGNSDGSDDHPAHA